MFLCDHGYIISHFSKISEWAHCYHLLVCASLTAHEHISCVIANDLPLAYTIIYDQTTELYECWTLVNCLVALELAML